MDIIITDLKPENTGVWFYKNTITNLLVIDIGGLRYWGKITNQLVTGTSLYCPLELSLQLIYGVAYIKIQDNMFNSVF